LSLSRLSFLTTHLTRRQAYRDAASVLFLRDKVAIRETDALAGEVLELLASRTTPATEAGQGRAGPQG